MKDSYTPKEVKVMLQALQEFTEEHDMKVEFEYRLNDKGLNGNNGENEDMKEQFDEDFINSFMD